MGKRYCKLPSSVLVDIDTSINNFVTNDQTRLFRRLIKSCSIILKKEEQYVSKHHTRFDMMRSFQLSRVATCPTLPCCYHFRSSVVHLPRSPVLLLVPLSGVTDSQRVTLIPGGTNDN